MSNRPAGNLESSDLELLSRRQLLRRGGLIAGTVGTAALLGACTQAGAQAWTFPPALPSATGGPVVAAGEGDATSPGPDASASGSPSPAASPSVTAHDPSPAGIVSPPPYKPKQAAPVEFTLESFDGPGQSIVIAPGKAYSSMNFAGQVPAPTLRVTEGDTVRFTLTNRGAIPHSIDFHAARTPWDKNYQTVDAGKSLSFEWTAADPGVFMYHCGAPPVIMHIGDGMFGTVIVDPKEGRPPAREYLLAQSEFYGTGGDYDAMMNKRPDVVAFNGQAFRYRDSPLPVEAGELIRVFLMNAGPNNLCSFHVIGALISRYEQDGNPENAQGLHQSVEVLPGGGALVELRIPERGMYPIVTHKMNDMEKGAFGLFEVS
jgi:nitrite reductase (NO-forming)